MNRSLLSPSSAHRIASCLALAALCGGCLEQTLLGRDLEPEDQGDDRVDTIEPVEDGCPVPGSPAAEGILALVNDPSTTLDHLDAPVRSGGVGLDRRAAEGLVDGRPFADLSALVAVPYVGRNACDALAQRACNIDERCISPVSFMSWNTEHFPLTSAAPEGVVDIVDEHRPVLVGMQEIEQTAALNDVVAQLPGYTSILGEPGPYTRVAALVDEQQFAVQQVEHLWVDDWWAFPRPVLAVTGQLLGSTQDTTITVLVVHLKAMGDATSQSRRQAAVSELRAWIDERRAAGSGRVMIVGDWNDLLTDAPEWNVFEPLLEDDADAAFLTAQAAESGLASYIPWSSMIDHVMVTEEILDAMPHQHTEVLYLDQTWSPDYEDTVSDHRPIRSQFGLSIAW